MKREGGEEKRRGGSWRCGIWKSFFSFFSAVNTASTPKCLIFHAPINIFPLALKQLNRSAGNVIVLSRIVRNLVLVVMLDVLWARNRRLIL